MKRGRENVAQQGAFPLLLERGLQQALVGLRMDDPDLSVIVRGDAKTKYRQIRAVLDVCQQANVVKVELATEAADKK